MVKPLLSMHATGCRLLVVSSVLALAGCNLPPRPPVTGSNEAFSKQSLAGEAFSSTSTHSREYKDAAQNTCEAGRRALLSQGYLITASGDDQVVARKNFQPQKEEHVELEIRVVCASQSNNPRARRSVAFVTATRERYALKKVNQSASVGVGVLGSLSLPISASDDAMVRVASETLPDGDTLYNDFFGLLEKFLNAQAANRAADEEAAKVAAEEAAKAKAAAEAASRAAAEAAAKAAAAKAAAAAAAANNNTPAEGGAAAPQAADDGVVMSLQGSRAGAAPSPTPASGAAAGEGAPRLGSAAAATGATP